MRWFDKKYKVLRDGKVVKQYGDLEDAAFYVSKNPTNAEITRNDQRVWAEGHEGGLSLATSLAIGVQIIRKRVAKLLGYDGRI